MTCSLDRALPAEQGVIFWAPQLSSDEGGPHCPSRKARRATGLEWVRFTGLEAGPMCGFQERLSAVGCGGRRCLLHIFPGSEKSTDLATRASES